MPNDFPVLLPATQELLPNGIDRTVKHSMKLFNRIDVTISNIKIFANILLNVELL